VYITITTIVNEMTWSDGMYDEFQRNFERMNQLYREEQEQKQQKEQKNDEDKK
jgi:hypothetical protein